MVDDLTGAVGVARQATRADDDLSRHRVSLHELRARDEHERDGSRLPGVSSCFEVRVDASLGDGTLSRSSSRASSPISSNCARGRSCGFASTTRPRSRHDWAVRVSAKVDYALRAGVELAVAQDGACAPRPVKDELTADPGAWEKR